MQRQIGAQEGQKRAGEDAVRVGIRVGQSIHRGLTFTGGIDDEAAVDRLRLQAARQSVAPLPGRRPKRIVAAGVDDRHLQARVLALEVVEHAVDAVAQRQREPRQTLQVDAVGRVDAHQIIVRAVAPAVAGIDEHDRVAGMNLFDEIRHCAGHVEYGKVIALPDREPLLAQHRSISLRIGLGLLQLVDVLILVIADDEREPGFRARGRR
jgi:hypothetical protein